MICASMVGCSFFPALHYRYYSLRFLQDIPAHLTGLSPRCFMHSPNCSSSTTTQFIRLDSSSADIRSSISQQLAPALPFCGISKLGDRFLILVSTKQFSLISP